ncbi:hypothetical protein EV182_000047 [Spiromyces aspiralis]|uniref:Uncharacterized protein n=1 Tax=Spiromyces aspiralis TaxID=68401 RepID=A0ACC1HNZ4_9FUNG|nr:hypothetical protein EV182_000047 [Spiromyces aspiralis]
MVSNPTTPAANDGCIDIASPLTPDDKRAAVPFDTSLLDRLTPTMKKFTLTDKVAVVTGGARGLGFNMCQALAEVGIRGIAIMDLQQEVGEESASELSEQSGVDVRFYRIDVRDAAAVNLAVQNIVEHYGRIDVLINSAGTAQSRIPAENYDIEMFRRQIDVNLTGSFIVAQAVAREMIKGNRGGSIIFIASMSSTIVNYPQEQCCYNATKAGVAHLTKSLAAEWARYNIRVNAISPGYMNTALNRVPGIDYYKNIWIENTPQKRLGNIDEINHLAVYLASDASTFMTGSQLLIDGGFHVY